MIVQFVVLPAKFNPSLNEEGQTFPREMMFFFFSSMPNKKYVDLNSTLCFLGDCLFLFGFENCLSDIHVEEIALSER